MPARIKMWVQTVRPNCQADTCSKWSHEKGRKYMSWNKHPPGNYIDTFQTEEPCLKTGMKKALTLVIGAESLEWKQQPSGLCDMGKPQCHGFWWGPTASGALLELGSATSHPVGTLSSYPQLPQSHNWAPLEHTPWGAESPPGRGRRCWWGPRLIWAYPSLLQQGCVDRVPCTLR